MVRPIIATLAASGVLLVAGCSAPAGQAQSAASVPLETPAPDETSASPAPSAAETGPLKVGRTQTTRNSDDQDVVLAVTVGRVRSPFKANMPGLPERKAYQYAAIDIKFCVKRNKSDENIVVGWSPWTLTTKDGVVVEVLGAWSDSWWDEPLYPRDHVVRPGRCVRGWLPFEVQKTAKVDVVTYDPQDFDTLEWQVQ